MNQHKDTTESGSVPPSPERIEERLQRLATLIVTTSPTDLEGMATISDGFHELAGMAIAKESVTVGRLIQEGEELMWQVMLKIRPNAAAALKMAGEIVADVQHALEKGAG